MKINKEELRKELIEIYEGLLKNRMNPVIRVRAIEMSKEYSYATDLLDESLSMAINSLLFVIQAKMPDESNREEEIKKILNKLKENKY